jgi:hypothetical protein
LIIPKIEGARAGKQYAYLNSETFPYATSPKGIKN